MKLIPLAALCIALAGCAAAPETARETAAREVAASETVPSKDIEVAAVVELEAPSELEPEEPCRRTSVTGTRISRMRCEPDIPESQRILDEELVRSEVEYAREMALIEEQRRAEQAAAAAQRQMEMRRLR